MRVVIDEEKCVGSGQCVLAADDVFDQRDDGIAVLLDADPPKGRLADVQHAAAICPGLAITVEG